jgi:hypothetical protein
LLQVVNTKIYRFLDLSQFNFQYLGERNVQRNQKKTKLHWLLVLSLVSL